MLNKTIWTILSFVILISGCSLFEDNNEAMVPPSANYSPIQAPIYPPLNQPYSPNMLNDNDNRVMNIDRLNVGEANISGYPSNPPNLQDNQMQQMPNNQSVDIYIKDQRENNMAMPNYVAPNEVVPYDQVMPQVPYEEPKKPQEMAKENMMIQNSPILTPSNTIELNAVGMGVAPETTISPSQALALAKRAAIIDAYRQIGEKMYGIRLNAQDTVRDMVLINSVVKTKVEALIKNAEIIETVYKDGLCQITMELKLDGKIWHKILSAN